VPANVDGPPELPNMPEGHFELMVLVGSGAIDNRAFLDMRDQVLLVVRQPDPVALNHRQASPGGISSAISGPR
jgi:hypothetical protein